VGIDPFTVYVITVKDSAGKPRGIEKSTGKIYFTEIEAQSNITEDYQIIQECVIMGNVYFQKLMEHYTPD
jgi:hypothetical protein